VAVAELASLGVVHRRRLLWIAVIAAALFVLVLGAIPIIHPLRFFWRTGECDLQISGYLPPHGGERGVHLYDARLESVVRIRTLAIDFAFVAWEFVLTERVRDGR
jgi:hypothetical protein